VCPDCETPTVSAWGCDEQYLAKLQGERDARKPAPYQFGRTVKKVFQATNSVSKAAFRAEQLAERLSQRRPKDGDSKGYIDAVEFDISRFNIRAQMVVDMVMVKSLSAQSNPRLAPRASPRTSPQSSPKGQRIGLSPSNERLLA
jgi:hypothetical protein